MNPVLINRFAYQSEQQIRQHCHEQTQLTMVVAGTMEEIVEGERRTYGPLDILIKPAGTPHTNEFGDRGAETIQFSLNPEWINDWPDLNVLNQYHSFFCPQLNRAILRLFGELRSERKLTNRHSQNTFERLRKNIVAAAKSASSDPRPRWLESIAAKIKSDSSAAFSVNSAATDVDRHRVSVSRAFRKHYGTSFKKLQQQMRIKRAAQLLADSNVQLAAVSVDCGFADQSHLTRVFKSHTGLTPNQFRDLVR